MGTHPIFESDFDCLTDLKKVWSLQLSHPFFAPVAGSPFSSALATATNATTLCPWFAWASVSARLRSPTPTWMHVWRRCASPPRSTPRTRTSTALPRSKCDEPAAATMLFFPLFIRNKKHHHSPKKKKKKKTTSPPQKKKKKKKKKS